MRFDTAYLDSIFVSPLKYRKLIDRIADQMADLKKKKRFSAIAFRGESGAALAYPLSAKLNIPIVCIRKARSHGFRVEGSHRDIRKYVIIDDFMETGNTIRAILKSIDHEEEWRRREDDKGIKCVGIVLYAEEYEDNWSKKFFTYKGVKIPLHHWG